MGEDKKAKAEYVLFQALSYKKLGQVNHYNSLTNKLIKYGENQINKKLEIDFFAVSLPDTHVFNRNLKTINQVHVL